MELNSVNSTHKDKDRRPLHILQRAADNNEILVGADRIIKSTHQLKGAKLDTNLAKRNNSKYKKKIKKDKAVQTAREEKVKIEVKDLISTDNPSENYWQVLAERRQTALENTLAENKKLEQHIEVLEEKVHVYKKQLDETRAFIEILQEIIEEREEDNRSTNNLSDDNLL
ncbi:hypothetical protein HN011_009858 [Eciton burchellii]|nr:hypothetical protein HN011_009858 [Eciton burchellii]